MGTGSHVTGCGPGHEGTDRAILLEGSTAKTFRELDVPPATVHLSLRHCESLQTLDGVAGLVHLQSLDIGHCDNLVEIIARAVRVAGAGLDIAIVSYRRSVAEVRELVAALSD